MYDGDGGRVKKIAGTTTTRYIGKLYECDNTSCTRFIFAGNVRIATVAVNTGAIHYWHQDHLGSSSVITDNTGTLVQTLAYYPYGATRTNQSSANPAVDVPYKYTGKELDSTTGLYYYEARYYDPTLGRFISADTIVPNPRDPQDLNRYTYAGNNPFKYADPTGHFKLRRFLKKTLGDAGITALGLAIQIFGGPVLSAILPATCGVLNGCGAVAGGAVLTQSRSGRYVLAGEIVVGSALASWKCGGCLAAVGAAVGSSVTGGLGGYSAAKAGGDISQGVLFGAVAGAGAGALGALINPALPTVGASWGQLAAFAFDQAVTGAVVGVASGVTTGYAGGAGNWNTILTGAWQGAAAGTVTGLVLGGAEFLFDRLATLRFDQVNVEGNITELVKTAKNSIELARSFFGSGVVNSFTSYVEQSALAVGSGLEITDRVISGTIDAQLQRQLDQCHSESGCRFNLYRGRF